MYHCCLCGKKYDTEALAVRCVNKCGREAFATGKFVKKDVPQLPDVTNVEFDYDTATAALHSFNASLLFEQMILMGAPVSQVAALQHSTYKDWEQLSNKDRSIRLNRVFMTAKLYGIEIPLT